MTEWGKRVGALVVGLTVAGCAAQYRNHGYVPAQEDLDEIIVGVDTRDTVQQTVGSPTSAGLLNDSGYFYVRSRVRSFAYQRPEVVEREVVAISFDQAGVVENIERFGLEDGQLVVLDRRVTKGGDVSPNFLRQLLGAIGRLPQAGDL